MSIQPGDEYDSLVTFTSKILGFLQIVHFLICTVLLHQFTVCAGLLDDTVSEDDDLVGIDRA